MAHRGRAVIEPMERRVLMSATFPRVVLSSYSAGVAAAREPADVEAGYVAPAGATAAAVHPGGILIGLGDGSVRF